LKKLARSLIVGAADESISLFDVHYDQMFHRGPPPTAKLSGRDRFSKPHKTSSAPISISSRHSAASTTKKGRLSRQPIVELARRGRRQGQGM
jgi:hypothetical protein